MRPWKIQILWFSEPGGTGNDRVIHTSRIRGSPADVVKSHTQTVTSMQRISSTYSKLNQQDIVYVTVLWEINEYLFVAIFFLWSVKENSKNWEICGSAFFQGFSKILWLNDCWNFDSENVCNLNKQLLLGQMLTALGEVKKKQQQKVLFRWIDFPIVYFNIKFVRF